MPPTRPELENPPDVYYNRAGAMRYTSSTRVQGVQRAMTLRALELLALPAGSTALLLDVGCGSGISGDVIRDAGHTWVGVDISSDMLALAKASEENEEKQDDSINWRHSAQGEEEKCNGGSGGPCVDLRNVKWGLITESGEEECNCGDDSEEEDEEEENDEGVTPGPSTVEVIRGDMGQGLPFRPGSFDGAVSISAIQWLCQSDCRGHVPQRRLRAFFQCLYNALHRGAKAALQFYPSNVDQTHMITRAAMLSGFTGGVVVDFPHSAKAKKHYLVVQAGQIAGGFVPRPPLTACLSGAESGDEENEEDFDANGYVMGDDDSEQRLKVRVGGRMRAKRTRTSSGGVASRRRRKDNRPVTGSKEWVLQKKAERRKFGLPTTCDSKYTMRKRRPKF